ncbi:MAG: queuosine precursor transporter [Chitinophagaceae bacterium]|nr:queuosine precursor transporter [Chitinophagaceae bacterium]MCB0739777.1 queuosine precursor transporter [Chitinophagaceae bacterium]HQU55930.1 queuosine precursor transporter [Chitinophagaceae bacterium]HQV05327.1 queuosine precursor transporter [Chitinophagaceae bacterium]
MIKAIIKNKPTRLFLILGGFFIANAIVAEIIGVKIFSLEKTFGLLPLNMHLLGNDLSFNLTAGVLIWPIVFVMTDIINEYYGMRGVRFLSWLTAGLIAFAFIVFMGAIQLVPADFFITSKQGSGVPDMSKAYNSVLGQGGFIIIGSVTAFILGQLIDVFIFHRIKKVTGEKKIWLRATGSTLISQFIDSFVVLFIAFYIGTRVNASGNDFVWPFKLFIAVGIVNYIYKFIIAIIMTPVIYLIHHIIERYLGEEQATAMREAAMTNT